MTVNAPRLQSFVSRIEKLIEEKQAIAADIKDVFNEAKGVGYDVKTLRRVIKARAMDPAERDEQESLFDTYMHALGHKVEVAVRAVHEGALSLREAAAKAGVSKSTIQRSVPKEGAPGNLGTLENTASAPPPQSEPERRVGTGDIDLTPPAFLVRRRA